MVKPYDIATVVSRSYVSEQAQNNVQRGHESHSAQFLQEFKKAADKKSSSVQKTDQSDNPTISKEAVQRLEEKKKRDRRDGEQSHDQHAAQADDENGLERIDLRA